MVPRKPFYTDGASWYNDACKWLRLKHQVYDTGLDGKICTTDKR